MSAPISKDFAERRFCPVTSRDGRRCDFAEHPGAVHWSWVEGELQFWQALPAVGERWVNLPAAEDPLRDAPQALISDAVRVPPEMVGDFNPLANLYRDSALTQSYLSRIDPKGHEMVHDLLVRGRTPEIWNRPLVEARSLDGDFAYGLLETPYSSGHGVPVVHETVPESGGVPNRVAVDAESLREVFVPGHRGGCAGDCCREGYSEETSYPECWTWDQVRTGIAEKYRAWKNWAL